MSAGFYQHFWDIVGQDVTRTFLDCLNNGVNILDINKVNIVLIPKLKNLRSTKVFRPISLCNVIHKLFPMCWLIVWRWCLLAKSKVPLYQAVLIFDNSMVAYKLFTWRKTEERGKMKLWHLSLTWARLWWVSWIDGEWWLWSAFALFSTLCWLTTAMWVLSIPREGSNKAIPSRLTFFFFVPKGLPLLFRGLWRKGT